jgi:hypothetical protein
VGVEDGGVEKEVVEVEEVGEVEEEEAGEVEGEEEVLLFWRRFQTLSETRWTDLKITKTASETRW